MLKVHAFVTGTIAEEIEMVKVGKGLSMCSLTVDVESFRPVTSAKIPASRLTLRVTGEQADNCHEQLRLGSSVGIAVALSGAQRRAVITEGVALAVYFVGPHSRVAAIA